MSHVHLFFESAIKMFQSENLLLERITWNFLPQEQRKKKKKKKKKK